MHLHWRELAACAADLPWDHWDEDAFLLELPRKWEYSFVAREAGEIAGYVVVSDKPDCAYLHQVVLAPQVRRRGYGSAVWAELRQRLRAVSTRRTLRWKVEIANTSAVAFYQAHGAATVGTDGAYQIMERPIGIVAAIHQPNYLPWLGYFAKLLQCDVFILLDTVQFQRRSYTQRCRVAGPNGPTWLTVPVEVRGRYDQAIRDTRVDASRAWARKHWETLRHGYGHAPHWDAVAEWLAALYESPHERLLDMNCAGLEALCAALRLRRRFVLASELAATGAKSDLLAALCRAVDARVYVSGEGARAYNEPETFAAAGVDLVYSLFTHPTYRLGADSFTSGLSTVDALCWAGPEARGLLLQSGR